MSQDSCLRRVSGRIPSRGPVPNSDQSDQAESVSAVPEEGLSFRAESAHRFLKLSRREVEVGLHLGGEMSVMLEAKTLRNYLKGKAFRDQTTCQKHAMTTEEFLGPETGSPLNGVLQLPVGQFQRVSNPGDREAFGFGEFEQIVPVGTHEPLPLAGNSERSWILSHLSVWEGFINKQMSSVQESNFHHILT